MNTLGEIAQTLWDVVTGLVGLVVMFLVLAVINALFLARSLVLCWVPFHASGRGYRDLRLSGIMWTLRISGILILIGLSDVIFKWS